MKKRFVAVLALVVLMMAGCGNSNSADEPVGADSQTMDNTDQTNIEENGDISVEEAEKILREYLISVNILKSDYVLESFDPVLGEFENGQIFRFEMRFKEDIDEVGGRLIDNYAITTDGTKIFWYNPADDEWVQQIGNGVVDNTVLDQDVNEESCYWQRKKLSIATEMQSGKVLINEVVKRRIKRKDFKRSSTIDNYEVNYVHNYSLIS